MFHFDRIQQRLLLILGTAILLLSGFLLYREYVHRNDGPLVTAQHLLDNPAVARQQLPDAAQQPAAPEQGNGAGAARQGNPAGGGDEKKAIKVYVTGQVQFKGLITLSEGDRIADAIELAGGALPDADLNRINLALKVKDEDMIYIPAVGEDLPSASLASAASNEDGRGGKVNINKADQALLETLNGIGPSKAQKIIEYREENGGFKTIEEIMNVSGIGEKTFEGLKDQIKID